MNLALVTVLVHVDHLMQGVPKMVSTDYPRKLLAIKLDRSRVLHIVHPTTEV